MTKGPTHHSTGPAQKAAQAGEFRRWASEILPLANYPKMG
jgi:hypothetical protein